MHAYFISYDGFRQRTMHALTIPLQVSAVHGTFSIICWTVYSHSPKYLLPPALTLPVVSITSQRIVLNLRSLKANHLMIHELTHCVGRQWNGVCGEPHHSQS
ncbi:hypothetical protein V8B97DRAFT_267499 [Scleroderma yunnanense]